MPSARLPYRVSVIIPVYNALYLSEALASIASQQRPVDELIVVDDGSPDGAAIEEAVTAFGDRPLLIRQTNQGAAAARNNGHAGTFRQPCRASRGRCGWHRGGRPEPRLSGCTSRRSSRGVFTAGSILNSPRRFNRVDGAPVTNDAADAR